MRLAVQVAVATAVVVLDVGFALARLPKRYRVPPMFYAYLLIHFAEAGAVIGVLFSGSIVALAFLALSTGGSYALGRRLALRATKGSGAPEIRPM